MIQVCIALLPGNEDLPIPQYQTEGSVAVDLYAAVEEGAVYVLAPKEIMSVPCGFKMMVPDGFEAQIRPRSGLALNNGVTVINSPGTVDSDYRGQVMVPLINHSDCDFTIMRGMRIAQMLIKPAPRFKLRVVDSLPETKRGSGGFGSTGLGTTRAQIDTTAKIMETVK